MYKTIFKKLDFKGTCDICEKENKVLFAINPFTEKAEVDAYLCAKCKSKILEAEGEKINEIVVNDPLFRIASDYNRVEISSYIKSGMTEFFSIKLDNAKEVARKFAYKRKSYIYPIFDKKSVLTGYGIPK